jgi:hypothetical protein
MTFARPVTHDQMPPELWQEIFQISTLPRSSYKSDAVLPAVFQTSEPEQWKTRRSLVLVCKRWRAMATKFLYREVMVISDQWGELLLETLEQSAQNSAGYGIWVRRIVLPKWYTNPPIFFHGLLRYCPLVETIIRPQGIGQGLTDPNFWQDVFHASSGIPATPLASLASLRHLLWVDSVAWDEGTIREDPMGLPEIIIHAPNLQTLFITTTGPCFNNVFGQLTCRHVQPETALLPSLRSFTFCAIINISCLGLRPTDMPKLTHLKLYPCIRRRPPEFPAFLSLIGMQLHTVELMPCIDPPHRHNVWRILRDCPNLYELSYDVRNTRIVPRNPSSHASLSCIRLRYLSQPPGMHDSEWDANVWAQFAVFADPVALPALKSVVILRNGAAPVAVNDVLLLQQSVRKLKEFLGKRSCRLEYLGDTVI